MGRLKAFGKGQKRSGLDTPSITAPGASQAAEPTTPAVSIAAHVCAQLDSDMTCVGCPAPFSPKDATANPVFRPAKPAVVQ